MAKKIVKKKSSVKKAAPAKSAKNLKTTKSKPAVKKTVAKKAPTKAALKTLPAKDSKQKSNVVVKADTAQKTLHIKVEPQPSNQPSRAPVRKVLGANGVISVIKKNEEPMKLSEAAKEIKVVVPEAKIEAKPEIKVVQENKRIEDRKLIQDIRNDQKVAWNALPKYLPAHVRFLIDASRKECEKAANSPFPFAKFINSMPAKMCGLEFAYLILSLEHSNDSIADLCKLSADSIERISANAVANFTDKFSSECADMTRKLQTQLAGSGLAIDTLTEQYSISTVDKNFQTMLGAIILKCLGAKNLNYQPTALAS